MAMSLSLFRRATVVGALAVLLAPALARAAEYYVSPTGSDSAAGTSAAPFATLSKANSAAASGRHDLGARGDLLHHLAAHPLEERHLGHQPHQDLGGRG